MNNQVIEINKEHMLSQIRKMITPFCNALIEKNNQIEELQQQVKHIDKSRVGLARAYAKELGVLVTKRKWEKVSQNSTKTK